MTEHERILLYSYIYNNRLQLENEVKQLQANVRYRRIDSADCFELLTALIRQECFIEITEHILYLIGGHYKNE